MNVLVLSFCSLRCQTFSAYGGKTPKVMPATEGFFRDSSFVFKNAFNGTPWVGIRSYVEKYMTREWVEGEGYRPLGIRRVFELFPIPNDPLLVRKLDYHGSQNDLKKDYGKSFDKLKRKILNSGDQPFFVIAHIKYLHYPLVDKFNADSEWDYFLSQGQKARVDDLRKNWQKYQDKIPLLILLFNDPSLLAKNKRVRQFLAGAGASPSTDLLGLVNDENLIAEWKKSAGYSEDLELVQKIYAANERHLDRLVAPFYDLFGDRELKRKTLVVFVGDHGEMHMEHDLLTHGTDIYDDSMRVPLALRFPGAEGHQTGVARQTDFFTLAKLLQEVIAGKLDAHDLKDFLEKNASPNMIVRDCSMRWRGVRNAQYKYRVRVADDHRSLFDLSADPGETRDIIERKPKVAETLERWFWEHEPDLKGVNLEECVAGE